MSLVPFVHLDVSLDGVGSGDELPLAHDDAHHLTTVLRLTPGSPVEVADGHGRSAVGEVAAPGRGVVLRSDPIERQRPRPRLEVAQALPKGRRFDEVVRQVTELDVDAVIPLATERCVVRLTGTKAERAVGRWSAVARAACEQARRSTRPDIGPIIGIGDLAASARDRTTLALVAHPGGEPLDDHVAAPPTAGRVLVVIGPEGGLTDGEVAVLTAAGARTIGLGPTTLRTEHAAAAAVAALSCALGRWR